MLSFSHLSVGADGPSAQQREADTTRFYRRKLPHYREDNCRYYVTWRLARGQSKLQPHERSLVIEKLRHDAGQKYEIDACVVMDDHVHAIIRPLGAVPLESILQSWKSYTAHEIQKSRGARGNLWQSEYFDRVIRDDRELEEKRRYIRNNPFKRWPEIESYAWLMPQED